MTYRDNYELHIEDSDKASVSKFIDDQIFEPSLPRRDRSTSAEIDSLPRRDRPVSAEVGSLPNRSRDILTRPDIGHAYGSLSTFHQIVPQPGSSPISALRAAQIAGSESPEDSTRKLPPGNRSTQGSRSSLRSTDGVRRPSVSFQPFKAPTLSSSPSPIDHTLQRNSLSKNSPLAALVEARNPTAARPTSRGSTNVESAPTSDLPRPPAVPRFSSSFGHRKSKLSAGGSKTEDDTSSGKASAVSSNAQPGSGLLAGEASSGSMQTDDDNIAEFLKLLDQKKTLRSFRPPRDGSGVETSNRRTNSALNRFQQMRESNTALTDSMSSSLMVHRTSTSSSQRTGNVPAMIAGTSTSVSTSPGKPISPLTPHTPAIPSRLSANSIAEYPVDSSASEDTATGPGQPTDTIGAIDIPNSPRPYQPSYRRSSSVAQRRDRPTSTDDDEIFPFGMRSASLGVNDDRPPLSLNQLANLSGDQPSQDTPSAQPPRDLVYGPMYEPVDSGTTPEPGVSSSARDERSAQRARAGPYRPRIGRGSGRGDTPPQGSSSSLAERSSASGSSDQRGGRFSIPRPGSTFDDDEPLFFAISDIPTANQPRRSLEEARGGGDSASSSKRGNRRGGS